MGPADPSGEFISQNEAGEVFCFQGSVLGKGYVKRSLPHRFQFLESFPRAGQDQMPAKPLQTQFDLGSVPRLSTIAIGLQSITTCSIAIGCDIGFGSACR